MMKSPKTRPCPYWYGLWYNLYGIIMNVMAWSCDRQRDHEPRPVSSHHRGIGCSGPKCTEMWALIKMQPLNTLNPHRSNITTDSDNVRKEFQKGCYNFFLKDLFIIYFDFIIHLYTYMYIYSFLFMYIYSFFFLFFYLRKKYFMRMFKILNEIYSMWNCYVSNLRKTKFKGHRYTRCKHIRGRTRIAS